ncbi:MAG: alkylation response protein AidB-like acyl-CoA dehydrogenase [Hyphomicrobiaceae bacterium]|jgi:alkylation response protein AidB-like acyl-CoA dehydrogenase
MRLRRAMDFGFSPEQRELQSQVRRFLDAECPLERVRQIMSSSDAHDAGLWGKMAELGWTALVVPEAYDGLGLAWEDLVIVAEEMGRSLCPSPYLAAVAASRAIAEIASEAQKKRWLPSVARGTSIPVLAVHDRADLLGEDGVTMEVEQVGESLALTGTKPFVGYAQAADLLIVAARERCGVSLFAVPADAAGVTITPHKLVDATYRSASVTFEAVTVDPADRLGEPGLVWSDLSTTLDAAAIALSAEMVGAAAAAIMMSVEYAKVREQFGQPIGRFQGVKHRLAELHVGMESSRSLAYYAAWAVDNTTENLAVDASRAKAFASRALDEAGEDCIQIHGGIGYTWECDAQLYYKRGRYCRNLMGSPEYHYERLLAVQGV